MSCKTGSATNIIYGLALGYKSTIVPVFVLAAIIFTSFQLCGTYGAHVARDRWREREIRRLCLISVTMAGRLRLRLRR